MGRWRGEEASQPQESRKFLGSSAASRKELSVEEQWTVGDIVYTSGPLAVCSASGSQERRKG